MPEALRLPSELVLGEVELVVRDAGLVARFYRDLLQASEQTTKGSRILYHSSQPQIPLLLLHEDPQAPEPHPRAPGLYHTAFRVGSRGELARSLVRMSNLGIYLDGVADHLVSEALYLHDPELNGIEIYADKPKEKWPREGLFVKMDTLPLDLEALLAELPGSSATDTQVAIGHVHLKVSDLARAESFYCGLLGFEVKLRWQGALFVAAGDYHHHLGLNVWHSYQAGPLQPGTRGLRGFTIFLPPDSWKGVVDGLSATDLLHLEDGTATVTDPFGIQVRLKPMAL